MGDAELRVAGVPLGPRLKLLRSSFCAPQSRDTELWPEPTIGGGGGYGRFWDMDVKTDILQLQSIKTRLVLHIVSGRVNSTRAGKNKEILVHADDAPFVVLMSQVCLLLFCGCCIFCMYEYI